MSDDDVTNRAGIYQCIFIGEERHLSIRSFTPSQKRQAYERQCGICPACVSDGRANTHHTIEQMEGDHVTPWHKGGKTTPENCQMLCKEHNRRKSDK